MNIALVSRNDPSCHLILNGLVKWIKNRNRENCSVNFETKKCFGLKFFVQKINLREVNIVFVDDPFSYFFTRYVIGVKASKIVFYALEMYEYQLPLSTLVNKLRFIIFSIVSWISFLGASKVIFPSFLRSTYYAERFSFLKKKVSVLPNVPHSSFLEVSCPSQEVINLLRDIALSGRKILVYAGSIQAGRDILSIAESFACAQKAHFVIAGPIKEHYENENWKNLANVTYIGNLPRNQVNYIYQHADAGLLSYQDTILNTKYCAPIKIWEYFYFGLRILANNNYALKKEWSILIDYYYENPEEVPLLLDKIQLFKKQTDFLFQEYFLEKYVTENNWE